MVVFVVVYAQVAYAPRYSMSLLRSYRYVIVHDLDGVSTQGNKQQWFYPCI